jgi:hypothetical protein
MRCTPAVNVVVVSFARVPCQALEIDRYSVRGKEKVVHNGYQYCNAEQSDEESSVPSPPAPFLVLWWQSG